MGDPTKGGRKSSTYEVIAAVVLAALAIGSFALQAYTMDAKTTQRETVLFSTLQFLLTLGFGWFSTRAVTRAEFERSLKQFAVGAYRRITDIEAMVERLKHKLELMRHKTGPEASLNIDIVSAVIEDTVQVVRSSTADWADVIGDELLALEAIKTLQRQKSELEAKPEPAQQTSVIEEKLKEIDSRIERLTLQLPPNLQIESRRNQEDDHSRRHHFEWMRWRHEEEDGLRLRIVAGGAYKCDGALDTLTPDKELFVLTEESSGVAVEDAQSTLFGRALNNSPLDYDGFRRMLAGCFGTNRVPVRFVKHLAHREENDTKMAWYEVKVVAVPVKQEERHLGLSRRRKSAGAD